jgi:hypothetical protein
VLYEQHGGIKDNKNYEEEEEEGEGDRMNENK